MTLAGLLAAANVTGTRISHQRVVILGAGSSATGISAQLVAAMMSEGVAGREARASIWLIDSKGLVHSGRADLEPFKRAYARPAEQVNEWRTVQPGRISLEDVIRNVHPTVLIGVSAQPGAFTESLIREMARRVERPVIFPLSNPTSKSEAVPQDLINWTGGRALVATGSPFPDAIYNNRRIRVGQCNNAFIFPGVGLGVIAARARRVTDSMFVAAARALADLSPAMSDPDGSLYPGLDRVREVSRRVALAVAAEAQRAGVAMETTTDELERRVEEEMWTPRYARYKLKTE